MSESTNGVSGTIKRGRNTAKHAENLRKLGYKVEEPEGEDHIVVHGTAFVDEIDVSNGIEPLREAIGNGQLLTYGTRVHAPGRNKPLYAIPAAIALGELSCLMVRGPKKEKPKAEPQGFTIDDLEDTDK